MISAAQPNLWECGALYISLLFASQGGVQP